MRTTILVLFIISAILIAGSFAVGWSLAEPLPGAWPSPTPWR